MLIDELGNGVMRNLKTWSLCFATLLSLSVSGLAQDKSGNKPNDKSAEKPADKPAAQKTPAEAAFDRLKSLAGEWQVAEAPEGHGVHGGRVIYRVTAAGQAVVETLFVGTEHEMVTMYYLEGDDLMLTHYCILRNRPVMRAEKSDQLDKLVFSCQKGDKIEAEDHMHSVTFAFADADHVKADWVLYKGGKPDSTHTFELVRKKAVSRLRVVGSGQ
ncbi:MAG: hypothetical protein JSS02_06750 [Planctomycetes bacterium]|nr:hypothetical protein [Planctomycetota bacterium]